MELIPVDEAAARLHTSPARVMEMIGSGLLLAFLRRGAVQVLVDHVFLCGQRVAGVEHDEQPPARRPARRDGMSLN
jgi:hypothetical protein